MLLKDFKLEGEDENSYRIAHPAGRKLTLSKKGLSPQAHDMIKRMEMPNTAASPQRMADGGTAAGQQIQAEDAAIDQADAEKAATAAQNQPTALVDNVPGTNAAAAPEPAAIEPQEIPDQTSPQTPAAHANPFAANASATENLLNEEQNNVRDYLKQMGSVGGMEAGAYSKYADQLAGLKTPQEIVAAYKDKDDALSKAVAAGEIDPERFWHSKSTGSKVLSGIGLLLGGISSGITGQPNPASEHIKSAINADIDAQKADQSKSMNLWKMNRAAMDTDLQADLATKNQYLSITQAKVMGATAASNSAAAKLRGAQLISQIEQQKLQNRFKLGLLTASANGNAQGVDPAAYVGAIVDPKEQDQAYKDLDQVQKYNSRSGNIGKLFDQADRENTVMRTGAGMLRTPPSMIALNSEFDALAKDREGRVNEQVLKDLKANAPQPGDLPGTVQEKKANLGRMLEEGSSSALLDRYRVPYQKASAGPQLTPEQTQILNWAKQNPQDPRAALALKKFEKLGVQ